MDPYDPARWKDYATAVGQGSDTSVFGYPPHVAVAFAPLALLPTLAASLLWTLGTHAAAIAAILRWAGRMSWPAAPAVLLAGASWPAMLVFLQGQWGFALVATSVACIASLVARRDTAAGAALGVMVLAKPQLFVLAALALAAWAIRARRIRVLASAAAVVIAGLVIGTLAAPSWLATYLPYVVLPRSGRSTQQPTFSGLAGDLAGPAWPVVWVALVVALAALAYDAVRRAPAEHRPGLAFGSAVAISVGAAPYSWSYDHYLVLPLAASTLGVASTARMRPAVMALVAALLGPVAFALWESAYIRWHDTLAGLVPLLAVILAWAAVRAARERPERPRVVDG
jgi:HAMP domain-containing protein